MIQCSKFKRDHVEVLHKKNSFIVIVPLRNIHHHRMLFFSGKMQQEDGQLIKGVPSEKNEFHQYRSILSQ